MANNKAKINPCNPQAYLKELRDMTADLDVRFGDLQTAIEEALPGEPPPKPVGQPETETEYGPPAEGEPPPKEAENAIVKAIDQLDRPARARGLTQTIWRSFALIMPNDLLVPANPLRRSWALLDGGTALIFAPVPQPIGVPMPAFDSSTMGKPILFTEENWGQWVQEAWYYWQGGLLPVVSIMEEVYVQ